MPLYSHVLYDLVSSHTLRESLSSSTVWKDKLPLAKRKIERLRATVSEYLTEEVVIYNDLVTIVFYCLYFPALVKCCMKFVPYNVLLYHVQYRVMTDFYWHFLNS